MVAPTYLGDLRHECICAPLLIQRYRSRVSGPLLDRMDIHVDVPAVHYDDLARREGGENSSNIRQRVNAARARQLERFAPHPHLFCNAHMSTRHIRQCCPINGKGQELLEMAITKLGLSARAYDRIPG